MIVLAVVTAASTVEAQDTLRINSFQVVDVCSKDRSWLISFSLGKINFSDSLESFDISIGYDRNILRPTTVLKEGTLSAQLSKSPEMNTVVPNEMRIYGFNIARSIAGDLPLFAVSGDFVGTCTDVGVFTLPFPPDFNGEFKRKYTVLRFDSVKAVAVKKLEPLLGCEFNRDLETIQEMDSVVDVQIAVRGMGLTESDTVQLDFESLLLSDTAALRVVRFTGMNCVVASASTTLAKSSVVLTNVSKESSGVVVTLRRASADVAGFFRFKASLSDKSTCGCSRPGLIDTVTVSVLRSTVNVQPSSHDGTCTINVNQDILTGMCDHTQTKQLNLFDLQGRMIQQAESNGQRVSMSAAALPNGMYFVTLNCNRVHTQKLILK